MGQPNFGSGGALLNAMGQIAQATLPAAGPSPTQAYAYNRRLAPDLKRAAPGGYRNIRATSADCVRTWVKDNFKGHKDYEHMYSVAATIDFELEACSTPAEVDQKLAVSDTIEIGIRELFSAAHLHKTGNATAAKAMLAIQPPGAKQDVAPQWLVDSVTDSSKVAYQVAQRVATSSVDHDGTLVWRGAHGGRGAGGGGKGDKAVKGDGDKGNGKGDKGGGKARRGRGGRSE
jgi:hypothetical protein